MQTFPFKFTLTLGQINVVVLSLILEAVYLYNDGKKVISAFVLALAGTLKLSPLGLLPLFMIRKEFRLVIVSCLFFLMLNFFRPILFFDYFFQKAPQLFMRQADPSFYDQSLLALLLRLGVGPIFAQYLALSLSIALFGVTTFLSRQSIVDPKVKTMNLKI